MPSCKLIAAHDIKLGLLLSLLHIHFQSLRMHDGQKMCLNWQVLCGHCCLRWISTSVKMTFRGVQFLHISRILILVIRFSKKLIYPLNCTGSPALDFGAAFLLPLEALQITRIYRCLATLQIVKVVLSNHAGQPFAFPCISPIHEVLILCKFRQNIESVMVWHLLFQFSWRDHRSIVQRTFLGHSHATLRLNPPELNELIRGIRCRLTIIHSNKSIEHFSNRRRSQTIIYIFFTLIILQRRFDINYILLNLQQLLLKFFRRKLFIHRVLLPLVWSYQNLPLLSFLRKCLGPRR